MGLSISTNAKPKNVFKQRKEPKTEQNASASERAMVFASQDSLKESLTLHQNMETMKNRKENFQMPSLEDANARLGLRPVLEERGRKDRRNRGVEGERGKESRNNDFSLYDNAHRLIEDKVTSSMNLAEERKKFSMSPVKRARQALATEPDDGLDSGSKVQDNSDDDKDRLTNNASERSSRGSRINLFKKKRDTRDK